MPAQVAKHVVAHTVTPEKERETASNDETAPRKTGFTHLTRETSKLTPRRVLHLLRRILIFAAAITYLSISLSACIDSVHVLRGQANPPMDFVPYEARLMAHYAGTTTVRASPLVTHVLKNDTSPRNSTVYLQDAEATSFTTCQLTVKLPDGIYTNAFQRAAFQLLAYGTKNSITQLDPQSMEMVVPVVDCSSSSIALADTAAVRFFYVMRTVRDINDVYMLSVTMSIQEFQIVARGESGSAGVATIAFVNDLQATVVQHYVAVALGYPFTNAVLEAYEFVGTTADGSWQLQSLDDDPFTSRKLVQTASRTGVFYASETAQANIKNTVWTLSHEPLRVLDTWQWTGRPVLRDSWAWTHCLHALLAVSVLLNLITLLTVIVRNAQSGRLWVGDAFVSVSNTLWHRSALVLLSWYIDKCWALIEFCMHDGNVVSGTQSIFFYSSILRADLLALYFCLVSVIGIALKERIDPALTIGLFYISFEYRLVILKHFPALVDTITEYVQADYLRALSNRSDTEVATPLQSWSAHELVKPNAAFVVAVLFPVFSTFVVVIAYVAMRKVYRVFVPDKLLVQRITGTSENEEQLLHLKRNLTMFEIATGAALQNHYGIVADYTNCLYIKGVKYASADGVYSSGYVVANGKFLIQTEGLVTIWLMKLLRRRFRNVYVYDVSGTTVKQQARLVYPETMTVADLVNLNVGVLM